MERYFSELATAFVRGRLQNPTANIDDGLAAGLRLHKFKQNRDLARVRRVLSLLRSLTPTTLLDIGSGRGTFLWPLMAGFHEVAVTAIDVLDQRIADLKAVRQGGIHRLQVFQLAFLPSQRRQNPPLLNRRQFLQLLQEGDGAEVLDGMYGVKSQGVGMVIFQPHTGVL